MVIMDYNTLGKQTVLIPNNDQQTCREDRKNDRVRKLSFYKNHSKNRQTNVIAEY